MFSEAIPPFIQTILGVPDYRVKDWIFLNSPLWLFGILAVYFATIYGLAKVMTNQPPFQLRGPLIVYNSFQVLFSGYICKEIFMSAYLSGYKLSCTDYDLAPSKLNMRIQFLAVMFHILIGYQNKCKAPTWLTWFTVTYLWTLVLLFGNFYYRAYKSTKKIRIDLGQFCSQSGLMDDIPPTKAIDLKGGGDCKYD
ncbi:fatty acid acyl transferase-related [Holotrichia oblita]|uniref:Fatty acid acyl transferase-related n=1 Tax=Holotrichia oblita TaxID=644536 RepID=A0ACB9T5N0_HOLOL|nr:fatty acid acyl transferase-related [Holotrichia oblita]